MRQHALSVVIADDHDPLREELRADLEDHGFDVVGEAGDGLGAVCEALRTEPDVCLLDVQMPGDGIRAAEAIARQLPQVRIVMLTATRDDESALAALRAGAGGYLLKDLDPDLLDDALRRVAEGELVFPARQLQQAFDELRRSKGYVLAQQDWEVAELLEAGLSAAEVAEKTSLAADAVRDRIAWIAAALRGEQRATRDATDLG